MSLKLGHNLAAALLVCVCCSLPSHAAQPLPNLNTITKDASANYLAPAPGISLQQATAIARKHTGGKVLSANPRQRGGVMEY
ncbi:MAG: hypothetical protein AAF993_01650, partial [Pseudomonadota bacterium]